MKQKIAIMTDSTSNISFAEAKELGITIAPLNIVIDGHAFAEERDISNEDFLKALVGGQDISTSQPVVGEVIEIYENLLQTHDHVIYFTISSLLSGTYQSGYLAASEFEDKVTVIDSLSTSFPLKTFVLQALQMVNEGKSVDAIETYFNLNKTKSGIYIMPATLKYLEKGGRIDKKTAMIGNLLGIKPILLFKDGMIEPFAKVRALNKGIQLMINELKKHYPFEQFAYFVLHPNSPELADKAVQMLKEQIPEATLSVDFLPAVVTTHIGPEGVAIGYVQKY